jgi:hypothetical protein
VARLVSNTTSICQGRRKTITTKHVQSVTLYLLTGPSLLEESNEKAHALYLIDGRSFFQRAITFSTGNKKGC